jgi:uncharacterized protein
MMFHSYLTFLVILFSISFTTEKKEVISIPMRDGKTELKTDIYYAGDSIPTNTPCIVVRNPLGRTSLDNDLKQLYHSGYIIAIQGTRSHSQKFPPILPYMDDGYAYDNQDGYDTIEWLAKSPYSNGMVGTYGQSAIGITQLITAASRPPSLKAQYVKITVSDLYQHAIWRNGVYKWEQTNSWLESIQVPQLIEWMIQKPQDSYIWSLVNAMPYFKTIEHPIFYVSGWYDMFLEGTVESYTEQAKHHPDLPKIIIGPWDHKLKTIHDHQYPAPSSLNSEPNHSVVVWFDEHLRGIKPNKINTIPNVSYFLLGAKTSNTVGNRWISSEEWPVKTAAKHVFLNQNNLITTTPVDNNYTIKLSQDLNDSIPTLGGRNLDIESGPADLSEIITRNDTFVWTTDTLEKPLIIVGQAKLNIHLKNSPFDINTLFLKMVNIHPDGSHVLVCDLVSDTRLLDENETIEINFNPIAQVFDKDHKLGIILGLSDSPAYRIHHNKETNYRLSMGPNCSFELVLPTLDSVPETHG